MNKEVKVFLNKSSNYSVIEYIDKLEQENKQLKERIDKAIEYIENHLYMESDYGIQHPTLDGKMDYKTDGFELIQILKGENNDNKNI